MAKISGGHAGVLQALRAMGIEPHLTTKVVIEIDGIDQPIKVHVQQHGDEGVLGVMKAVDGNLRVVREVKKEASNG